MEKVLKCTTKSAQASQESESGCRYSVLLELPYFDPVRMLPIDPMHNLFLGTGKHMISIWLEHGLLTTKEFKIIQESVDRMVVPSDVGRIPLKIASGFSGFKADQFKNWINIYSIPALYDFLSNDHLECWRHFVLACRILCRNTLSHSDLDLADALLLHFCKRVERLYGESVITPNMHLHGHLKEVIKDYGPIQEIWLFSFERFNGILGKQPNNNRAIEPQLMNRFLRENIVSNYDFPTEFREVFEPVANLIRQPEVGSLLDTALSPHSSREFDLPKRYSRCTFSSDEQTYIHELFCKANPQISQASVTVNSLFLKYTSINLNGKKFFSSGRRKFPAVALLKWDDKLYGHSSPELATRPANIHYFIRASLTMSNQCTEYLTLAFVSWFSPHPSRHNLGKPAELWCSQLYEPQGIHSFVQIKDILSRCAHGIRQHHGENVIIVVPLVE